MQIELRTTAITDWESFHKVFKETFGFPDFYGMNMNAWIDCMSDLDEGGMTNFTLGRDESLIIALGNSESFRKRVPVVYDGLVECVAFVNERYSESGSNTRIELALN